MFVLPLMSKEDTITTIVKTMMILRCHHPRRDTMRRNVQPHVILVWCEEWFIASSPRLSGFYLSPSKSLWVNFINTINILISIIAIDVTHRSHSQSDTSVVVGIIKGAMLEVRYNTNSSRATKLKAESSTKKLRENFGTHISFPTEGTPNVWIN